MNADAALSCLTKAKTLYRSDSGKISEAIRLVEKSLRLHETKEANDFLVFLKSNPKSNSDSARSKPSKPTAEPKEEPARPFTPDQVTGIKRILEFKKKGDLYGIFGLEKNCSDNDIKKAYRKVFIRLIESARSNTTRINVEHQEQTMHSRVNCFN